MYSLSSFCRYDNFLPLHTTLKLNIQHFTSEILANFELSTLQLVDSFRMSLWTAFKHVRESSCCFGMASKITRLSNTSLTTANHYSATVSAITVREGRNMPAVFVQNAFDDMLNRCRRCRNAARHSFPGELCYK